MVETVVEVTGGVDTHRDTHTAAALDARGQLLGSMTFPADRHGQQHLVSWLQHLGSVTAVGVEGTGSYGATLARSLRAANLTVIEVDRPDRRTRRRLGKSDPIDAVAAARAVQAGTATTIPKTRDGVVESIRALHVTRRGAVKARTAAINALQQMVITAPNLLRDQLDGLSSTMLVKTCARLRPGPDLRDPTQTTKLALRQLARRILMLTAEITDTTAALNTLVQHTAPRLLDQLGVGVDVAAQLLITAGDNPTRLRSDAAFAALCGASPLPASSGRTDRHRLNRGGDRQANCALHRIVLTRMSHHPPTKAYIARRKVEGRTTKEIMRCLKRYLARELLPLINQALTPLDQT